MPISSLCSELTEPAHLPNEEATRGGRSWGGGPLWVMRLCQANKCAALVVRRPFAAKAPVATRAKGQRGQPDTSGCLFRPRWQRALPPWRFSMISGHCRLAKMSTWEPGTVFANPCTRTPGIGRRRMSLLPAFKEASIGRSGAPESPFLSSQRSHDHPFAVDVCCQI